MAGNAPELNAAYARLLRETESTRDPMELLAAAREACSVDTAAFRRLWYGSAEEESLQRRLRSVVEAEPALDASGIFTMTRLERHIHALKMQARLKSLEKELGLTTAHERAVLRHSVPEHIPTDLQSLMFVPNLAVLFSEEQQKEIMPLAESWSMIGCYAQTELGHGSNVRGIETTATFDPATDEFVLNSPTLTSIKWWPGSLGRTANFAVVYARLIVGDEDLGVHNFLVQIRSMEDHTLLPGVATGDIGPKLGYNTQDNGWMALDHVRIPRTNMAMRFAHLDRQGKFTRLGSSKVLYASMLHVRVLIVWDAPRRLSMAATIAVRYAHARRQGFAADGASEHAIIDYPSVQARLTPLVATAYVLRLAGFAVHSLYGDLCDGMSRDDLSLLPEMHGVVSGLKAFCSDVAYRGIEVARLACGGSGYLKASGLTDLYTYYAHSCTVEGDNYIIGQQCTRYLLRCLIAHQAGKPVPAVMEGLFARAAADGPVDMDASRDAWLDPAVLVEVFARMCVRKLTALALAMQRRVVDDGLSQHEAWTEQLVEINAVSDAFSLFYITRAAAAFLRQRLWDVAVDTAPSSATQAHAKAMEDVMTQMLALFVLTQVHGSARGLELASLGVCTLPQLASGRDLVPALLAALQPELVALTDAFDHSDAQLNSAIGRYDGDVYRALLESSRGSSLNAMEPAASYKAALRQLMGKL